jgi:hypothetical protein
MEGQHKMDFREINCMLSVGDVEPSGSATRSLAGNELHQLCDSVANVV